VLSIHKLTTGHGRYYIEGAEGRVDVVESVGDEVEEYYAGPSTEAHGTWIGVGALELGLSGTVDGDELRRVLDGLDADGEPLPGSSSAVCNAGYDLTFSAPKSVSVLFGVGEVEVREVAPESVERMRAASSHRDATLVSVLAYAGLRPGEALAPDRTSRRAAPRRLDGLANQRQRQRTGLPRPRRQAVVAPRVPVLAPTRLQTRRRRRRHRRHHALRAPGTRSPRSSCPRAAASSTSPGSSGTTRGSLSPGTDNVIDELDDQPRLPAEDAIKAARESLREQLLFPLSSPETRTHPESENEKRPKLA
jgi:hypothetical protein